MQQNEVLIATLDTLPSSHVKSHEPYEYFKHVVMGGKENACQVAFYQIPPGKANYPYHYHTNVTEVFYIISGHGILKTPEGDRTVRAGDAVVCPPFEKGAHKIINASQTQMLVYIDIDTVSPTDAAFYPDSGKVGVLVQDHYKAFFQMSEDTAYYDGE